MRSQTFTVTRPDGHRLVVDQWLPTGPPRAIVQIAHGMAEHAGRYHHLAQALTDAGYAVYANDHRGHARTARENGMPVGVLAPGGGFAAMVGDLAALGARAQADIPDVPLYLLGHSMGSFLARALCQHDGSSLAGLILSGTGADPGPLGFAGRAVARGEARLRGHDHPSRLMNTLTFGAYNKQFAPARTEFDWLSRDPAVVDAYIDDPDCGGSFSSGFYAELIGGLIQVNSTAHVSRTPVNLPILLISGAADPVGGNGKGVRAVGDHLRRVGVRDVCISLHPQARHEILNESHRAEVVAEILTWLESVPTRTAS